MTDPHDARDELAFAHLDGTATPEEVERAATDPQLRARVEELRAVRAALREVPPVDPHRRDQALAAALAAYEETAPPRHADVVPLAARRRSTRTMRVVGLAAAVALLALALPLLVGLGGEGDDEASFEATGDEIDSGTEAAEGGDTAVEDQASSPETSSTPASSRGLSLGSYPGLEELLLALGGTDGEAAFGPEPQGGANDLATRCPPLGDPAPGTVVRSATVAGEPVEVQLRDGPGGRTVTVVDVTTCELLLERTLP